jgi:hypothetical protein
MSGANNIDEVVVALDHIIAAALAERSRIGLFAALYRQVTLRIRQGIADGMFDDGPRMDRFDTVFANRYLDALAAWQTGRRPSKCWRVAFDATLRADLLILQHLLLGINAHINLDLGVAAAQVCPGAALPGLRADFERINLILATLSDDVEVVLERFSPLLHLVDRIGDEFDDSIINFSLTAAREDAWLHAQILAALPPAYQDATIAVIDAKTRFLGRVVAEPGPVVTRLLTIVRHPESDDIPAIITALDSIVV